MQSTATTPTWHTCPTRHTCHSSWHICTLVGFSTYHQNSCAPYPQHWMSCADQYANLVYWMVGHSCCPWSTDASMCDAAPARPSIDCPASICCAADDRWPPAFAAAPAIWTMATAIAIQNLQLPNIFGWLVVKTMLPQADSNIARSSTTDWQCAVWAGAAHWWPSFPQLSHRICPQTACGRCLQIVCHINSKQLSCSCCCSLRNSNQTQTQTHTHNLTHCAERNNLLFQYFM